jgi:glutathione S-transferase
MAQRAVRLYGIPLSHPVLAARGMLARKRLTYRYVELLAGTHPLSLWALGFRRPTVPAMKLSDGRGVQGSLAIARALEELVAAPRLYPAQPAARAAAEQAERWGERVLQPIPRRLIRWGLRHHLRQRRWFAQVATPLPAPQAVAVLLTPIVPIFVRQSGAQDSNVRRDLAALPEHLDRVDELIGRGVIGSHELGAADFQIGSSVRALLAYEDVGRLVRGRPAENLALRVAPEYPPIPAALPPQWLPPEAGAR